MAGTRVYLPSSGAPAISPAFDGSWESTGSADRIAASLTKTSTAMASKGVAENINNTSYDVLIRQYVLPVPLLAQTIDGTVKGQIRAQESSGTADDRAQLLIKVVSSDGLTVRGTLLAHDTGALANEFATGLTNRRFPRTAGSSLTPVVAQDGDFIVLEIGYRAHNASTTSFTGTLRFGDTGATDLPENETAATDDVPWIEFSRDIFTSIDVPSGVVTLSSLGVSEDIYAVPGIVTLTGGASDVRDEISAIVPAGLVTITGPAPIVQEALAFRMPFNLGGVGTWQQALPFDVVAPAFEGQFFLPFNVIGDATWQWFLPFDVLGDVSWQFVLPFAVVSQTLTPQVGTGAGSAITTTLTAPASVGATSIDVTSVAGISIGTLIQVGTEYRIVTGVSGLTLSFAEPLTGSYIVGTTVTANPALPGLVICDKRGLMLGVIPRGYFEITQAPSRVLGDSGSMQFRMARAENGVANPYTSLIQDDRIVYVADELGGEPWAGTITVRDWGSSAVDITADDATLLWTGPFIELKEAPSDSVTAASVYAKVLSLMNTQRAADGEPVWESDIQTTELFPGEVSFEDVTAFDAFQEIAHRSVTEFGWRSSFANGRVTFTFVARDEFDEPGFSISDGANGNVASNVSLHIDPSPIVNAVRVRGTPIDLTNQNKSTTCSTNALIECLDWMNDASGFTNPTQLIPEGYAEVDPGSRRRREALEIQLDWGLSNFEQQSATNEIVAQATALYHSFLRAYHDRFGRPFYVTDGWQYDGPPDEIEEFLNTGLGWRTRLKLVEWRGEPASMVMYSRSQRQALIVTYDIAKSTKKVRRVWFTPSDASIVATRMEFHGRVFVYETSGGVISERHGRFNFEHARRLVGPPVSFWWPEKKQYKTLRRMIRLLPSGVGAGDHEGWYHDTDQPIGPTTDGQAPYKRFVKVVLDEDVENDNFVEKVYDFEDRSICSWDPRRDGVGALINRTTIIRNQPVTRERWHFVPWGTGDGETELSTGIDETETVIYVVNAFVLPQTPPWAATIGEGLLAEDVRVYQQRGNKLWIRRARNETTAIPHAEGTSFKRREECDEEPIDEPEEQTVPWPAGQAWAERLLAKLSKPNRRLTVQIVNNNDEWAKCTFGAMITANIQSEGPAGGITGTWRLLGWAPNYHAGTMELIVEEWT